MLLAIDVGNTHSVCGVWSGDRWLGIWRRATSPHATEDELAAWLLGMFDLSGIPWEVDSAVCGSVVPEVDASWKMLADKWLRIPLRFLRLGSEVGLRVDYDPPKAVGADRIANALGALARFKPPIIVVDFGTATTFDVVDASGVFVGGAILPGVALSSQALFEKAPRLPRIEYAAPEFAIGRSTVQSLQSGIMFGYAGAIDALAKKIDAELGGSTKIVATGGLGNLFIGLCKTIESYEPTLTLDGLVVASQLLSKIAYAISV